MRKHHYFYQKKIQHFRSYLGACYIRQRVANEILIISYLNQKISAMLNLSNDRVLVVSNAIFLLVFFRAEGAKHFWGVFSRRRRDFFCWDFGYSVGYFGYDFSENWILDTTLLDTTFLRWPRRGEGGIGEGIGEEGRNSGAREGKREREGGTEGRERERERDGRTEGASN